MPTSSFDRSIVIKGKNAVNRFYKILNTPAKKFIPGIDVEKELKKGIKALKKTFRKK